MHNQSIQPTVKTAIMALSVGVLFTLSACSGGDNTASDAAPEVNDAAPVTVVEPVTNTKTPSIDTPEQADDIIEPVAEVVAEMPDETAAETVEPAAVDVPEPVLAADAGATLYASNCKVCHDSGLLNAPKYGDAVAWAPRLSKGKETLYLHSSQGFNKMPAQAINGITEAQVKASVDYMLASVS